MAGTTTITAENPNGGEVVMWIQNEDNKEILGLLIPSAISWALADLSSW